MHHGCSCWFGGAAPPQDVGRKILLSGRPHVSCRCQHPCHRRRRRPHFCVAAEGAAPLHRAAVSQCRPPSGTPPQGPYPSALPGPPGAALTPWLTEAAWSLHRQRRLVGVGVRAVLTSLRSGVEVPGSAAAAAAAPKSWAAAGMAAGAVPSCRHCWCGCGFRTPRRLSKGGAVQRACHPLRRSLQHALRHPLHQPARCCCCCRPWPPQGQLHPNSLHRRLPPRPPCCPRRRLTPTGCPPGGTLARRPRVATAAAARKTVPWRKAERWKRSTRQVSVAAAAAQGQDNGFSWNNARGCVAACLTSCLVPSQMVTESS